MLCEDRGCFNDATRIFKPDKEASYEKSLCEYHYNTELKLYEVRQRALQYHKKAETLRDKLTASLKEIAKEEQQKRAQTELSSKLSSFYPLDFCIFLQTEEVFDYIVEQLNKEKEINFNEPKALKAKA